LQAGGHRFDPGWLHPQNRRFHAGFCTVGQPAPLAASVGWKRFGSASIVGYRRLGSDALGETPTSCQSGRPRWCRWRDASPNEKAAARHEPKPYASPPPKSLRGTDDFAIVFADTAKLGQATRPRASEPKRAGSVRGWVSALLDFDPSVSPQGEVGGDEAEAKAPRQVKHDRGWFESPMSRRRSRPNGSIPPTTALPQQGGRSVSTRQPEPSGRQSDRQG
jgi:hypothetical protein